MAEASIDRKLERLAREIEEAKRKAQPLTPDQFHFGNAPGPDGTVKPVKERPPLKPKAQQVKEITEWTPLGELGCDEVRRVALRCTARLGPGWCFSAGAFTYRILREVRQQEQFFYYEAEQESIAPARKVTLEDEA